MAFSKITKNMNIIAALDDEPNDVGGLSAAQLKAKFDEGGLALKTFINAWIDAIAAGTAAANIGAKDLNSQDTDLQTALDNLAGAVIGTLPDGSVTTAKLHDGAVTNAKIADGNIKDAKIDWADSAIGRIEVQNYAGTDTYGSSNKNTLTFVHEPKLVLIFGNIDGLNRQGANANYTAMLDWNRVKTGSGFRLMAPSSFNYENRYTLSNENKTITWYNTSDPSLQLNRGNTTYSVVSFY